MTVLLMPGGEKAASVVDGPIASEMVKALCYSSMSEAISISNKTLRSASMALVR